MTTDIDITCAEVINLFENMKSGPAKPILIIGGDAEKRTTLLDRISIRTGCATVNLGIKLPEAILQHDEAWTPLRTPVILASLVSKNASVALFDHIEVLFLPSLKNNVIDLLTQLARRTPVCVSWPGEMAAGRLRYANRDHPECLDEDPSRAIVIDITK